MLETWFTSRLRVQALRDSPSGARLEDFSEALCWAGYAKITARRHIRAAEHFIYWSYKQGIGEGPVDEEVLQRFNRHLSQCRCPGYGHTHWADLLHGARLFSGFLRGDGIGVTRLAEPAAEDSALFAAFCLWMRQQR